METEINPITILRPQNGIEKIRSLLLRNAPTKELIGRLRELGSSPSFPERTAQITLEDVGIYINRKFDEYHDQRLYPTIGVRQPKNRQYLIDMSTTMKQLFESGNYKPLIKIMMKEAINKWEIADLQDESWNAMSEKEKGIAISAKEYHERSEVEVVAKEKATPGYKGDHGLPPEMLELNGDINRQRSERFVGFAVALAKASK